MGDFEHYTQRSVSQIHFSGVFSRLRLFLTKILSAKEIFGQFSFGTYKRAAQREHTHTQNEDNNKKEDRKTSIQCVAVPRAVMSRSAHSELVFFCFCCSLQFIHSIQFSFFFFFFFFRSTMKLRLRVCRRFDTLQNVGHFKIYVCVQRQRSVQIRLYFEHYLHACAMQISV